MTDEIKRGLQFADAVDKMLAPKRDPLAGVQTALKECRAHFKEHVECWGERDSEEARLLTEVEVGLTLLREVRSEQRAASDGVTYKRGYGPGDGDSFIETAA